ncbi:hypothetical protein ABFS82_08G103300 [Erythranthe guttata]
MASCICTGTSTLFSDSQRIVRFGDFPSKRRRCLSVVSNRSSARRIAVCSSSDGGGKSSNQTETTGIQLYRDIERILTETAKQSQGGWGGSGDWSEIEGAWVLRPKNSKSTAIVHFIGSRYAVQRNGNILMAFNNKEASLAIPLFSPVLVPMAQSNAEMTRKQFENLSPSILKQVLPLVEHLSPLYMDLAKGRDEFSPRPEETQRLIRSYYGISRNLLIKFKDDTIDETSRLAQVLSSESAISSMLDMSIRSLPGDHGLPLQQVMPDVPPGMADAVNRGGELLATLSAGTPWESVAKEVGSTFTTDSRIFRSENTKDIDLLVDTIASWIASNASARLLRS